MSHNTDTPSGARLRGFATVLLITAFFGVLWGLVGASALPAGPAFPAAVLVVAATAVLLLAAARLFYLSRRLPVSSEGASVNPFGTRPYRLAVLFQVVAIPVAAGVLNNAGYQGAVISSVAVIVGLHFFGLIPAFESWSFAAVGSAMVFVGVLSLLLPAGPEGSGTSPRGALVGLGCALVLWVSVLRPLISTWRQVGPTPET